MSVVPLDGGDRREPLALMAAVEAGSEHPLGVAVARAARERGVTVPAAADFRALPGLGARAIVAGRRRWAGGSRLAHEEGAAAPAAVGVLEARGETAVILGEGTRALAVFGLADRLRQGSADVLRALREDAGVRELTMLTGDSEAVARTVAGRLGLADWRSGLMPDEKLEAIRSLEARHGAVAMIGDGVSDAPALAGATVGVAMGVAGSGVVLESGDVALMGDDLGRLPGVFRDALRALGVMRQSVAASPATKAVFVVLAPSATSPSSSRAPPTWGCRCW